MTKYKIAVVGATGVVGRTFLRVLEERRLPAESYTLFASKKSAGSKICFMSGEYEIKLLERGALASGFDIAFFSAGSDVSRIFAPEAAASGCLVIDNSSYFRMDENVPLVVPEVNPEDITKSRGIIANPNCSTIQAVTALFPLHKAYGLSRVVYSTYQAVSGAGAGGIADLEDGIRSYVLKTPAKAPSKLPQKVFGSPIPQIDVFMPDGYTKEEHKMISETRKILKTPDLPVTATCVRVPVFSGHSESVNVALEKPFELTEVKKLLSESAGIILADEPEKGVYPLAADCVGRDEVFVGRIRRDFSVKNGLNFWCVSDNLRRGAAANAVSIAQEYIRLCEK